MTPRIYLKAISSISALGTSPQEVWENLNSSNSKFQAYKGKSYQVSALSNAQNQALKDLSKEHKRYKNLDKTALLAMATGRGLIENTSIDSKKVGVNIGSSRGATQAFENAYKKYLTNAELPFATSPTTTLGNIATNVAQDLALEGPAISHSITCSSALHALLNGYAFLKSGLLSDFIIGGAEAALTGFTIEQMKVLKLYSTQQGNYPCRSLDFKKSKNTLVLGEACCLAHISTTPHTNAVQISGIGYATEQISHSISISAEAECIQKSMAMALQSANLKTVDVLVMHAPGTVKGDLSELRAVEHVFSKIPAITTNKWQIGHTFGASGAMSLEMGYLMLTKNRFISNPFYTNNKIPQKINTVMVNAVGFGGNAISVILQN